MKIISSPAEMTAFVESARANGGKIALVPTMGALHEGHLSLVKKAKTLADTVVVSIFVNPTQFGPNEDFDKYPRQLEADAANCEAAGADAVFAPSVSDVYLPDASTYVVEEDISRYLCGKTRPRHFRGVTTVVTILFNIVRPDIAVFGEKDAQQVSIIRRMVRDLFMGVEIVTGEIVRDENGLALSSRNKYLDKLERLGASRLHAALEDGRKLCLDRVLQRRPREGARYKQGDERQDARHIRGDCGRRNLHSDGGGRSRKVENIRRDLVRPDEAYRQRENLRRALTVNLLSEL